MNNILEPISLSDLKKGVVIPLEFFEPWLEKFKWTYHQLARHEFPKRFTTLEEFQLGCIYYDPVAFAWSFLRDPDNPELPWTFWDYQKESIHDGGHTLHECGSEVGKTREIISYILWKVFTQERGSGLITAPMAIHYIEIIDGILEQLSFNKLLKKSLILHRKHPHHHMKFANGFTIDFRPTGYDGEALRAVHVKTFVIMDEAAMAKNLKIFTELWRAGKPDCKFKLYSTPDGDRSSVFYRLCQKADGKELKEEEENINVLTKNIEFKKYHWSKELMPSPFWTPGRKRFYIDQYGGEDSPGYRQNVLGEWGDPENSVFPWYQFERLLKDIPEYKCLKIMVDEAHQEVSIFGVCYRLSANSETPDTTRPQETILCDKRIYKSEFDIKTEIKTFFSNIPGLKFAGADLGYSQDPTEIYVKLIIGKIHRLIARVQLKHVTYDEQADAIDAMDDVFNDNNMGWGLDAGAAGSAVTHILQGQDLYFDKLYEDRLTGYQFGSTYEAIDEDGDLIIDRHTNKPVKQLAKELATDLLIKKMQRFELEYPYDPDIILFYPNHTYRQGEKNRIYRKQDDHVIDADRALTLKIILQSDGSSDMFASGN